MAKTRSRTRAGERNDDVKELFPAEGQVASGFGDQSQGPETATPGVRVREGGESGTGSSSWLAFAAAFVLIVCVIASSTFLYSWISLGLSNVGGFLDHNGTYSRRFGIAGFLCCAVVSVLLGLSCCVFSCTVTYFDSMRPGLNPPTPMSPHVLRKKSGHNLHTGYAMSVLNGVAFFSYCLWSLRGYFWTPAES